MRLRLTRQRRGSTIVESALVLAVFCGLMFGAFEYCRFLYTLHLTNNAARDGARYAVVNMDKPSTFNTTNYTDASGKVYTNISLYTLQRMGGAERQIGASLSSPTTNVAVYAVDPTGLAQTPPVIRPVSVSGGTPYPNPFNLSDPNAVPWNQTAFPNTVAVTIKGDYTPALPTFLLMPSSIPVYITAIACSEG